LAAAAVLAIVAGLIGTAWQIHAASEAADERANAELRLAAISVVLSAPTCGAAEARADLAARVLPDIVPEDLAQRVSALPARNFDENRLNFVTGQFLGTNIRRLSRPTGIESIYLQLLKERAQEIRRNRDRLCSELSGRG
jgi:hypothetical protein